MRTSAAVGVAALACQTHAAANQTLINDINVISQYWGMIVISTRAERDV
jgi:hypothetical protein